MIKLEIIENVQNLRNLGYSYEKIKEELNISINRIKYLIRSGKVKAYQKGKHPNSRYKSPFKLDEKIFSNLNLESYYWAGFIAADGNIYNNQLTICLQARDNDHLEKLRQFIKTDQKLNYRKCGHPVLKISNSKICKDLLDNFNISPKKSLTLRAPLIKNSESIDAFILGYIDGDGSLYINNISGLDYFKISVLGTEDLLTFIKKRFDNLLNQKSANIKKYKNIRR